jgi:hypothetical protein
MFLILSVLFLIFAYPQNALFLFFSLYAVSGILAGMYKLVASIVKPLKEE